MAFSGLRAPWPSSLLALLLPAIGLLELGAGVWQRRSIAADDEWKAAEKVLAAERRDGDVIVVLPPWAEPHARRALGDPFFPIPMIARPDDSRPVRALVLVDDGHDLDEAGLDPRFFPRSAASPAQRLTAHLSLVTVPSTHPGTALDDLLDHAHPEAIGVTRRRGATQAGCSFRRGLPAVAGGLFAPPALPPDRWSCEGDAAFGERDPSLGGIAPTVQEDERFRPRRCLAAPIAGGQDTATVIETQALALGPFLTGHGGVYWTRQRTREGADVTLDVFLDDRSVGQVSFAEGRGFQPFQLRLDRPEGARGTLRFELRTRDGTARPFCFEATTRRASWNEVPP